MNEHDDSAWAALLRTNSTTPPIDGVDWTALHARIAAGAAPLLRRRTPTWWLLLGGGSTRVVRAVTAVAAVIIAIVSALAMPQRPEGLADTEFRTIEEVLTDGLPYTSVPLLAADADRGDVLDALLFYDREEQ
jgi:hypothetical protein